MAFRARLPIRFGDVDSAGVVFFPQYFVYFHEVFERFFEEGGLPYARYVVERRLGFPRVRVESDHAQPVRYGDVLDVALSVAHLGEHSVRLKYVGHRESDGARAVTAEITAVCIDVDAFRATVIPGDVRSLFERFRE